MYRVIWQTAPQETHLLEAFAKEVVPAQLRDLGVETIGNAEPVFNVHPVQLRATVSSLMRDTAAAPRPLALESYFHVFVKTLDAAQALKARLKADPGTRYADIQERPTPAVRFHSNRALALAPIGPNDPTPNFESQQGYLDPAPAGVGARGLWALNGGDGKGVTIADVEDAWNMQHEDLRGNTYEVVAGIPRQDARDHGTAVLGILGGDRNAFGITGLAPAARGVVAAAVYDDAAEKWNAADAIRAAADKLMAGDVMLLEMHSPGLHANPAPRAADDQMGFMPVEYWNSEFDAIRYAVAKGIYVVEAAGNGAEDLDHPDYQGVFDRTRWDSGAIMVGAGRSAWVANPRSRLDFSNYGRRLDVQGWGEDIFTCGGRDDAGYYDGQPSDDASRCYTRSFGGTSGASPIVCGVIAAIAGRLRARNKPRLSVPDMRALLAATGTAQTDGQFPLTQKIGPLPDGMAALKKLGIANPTLLERLGLARR